MTVGSGWAAELWRRADGPVALAAWQRSYTDAGTVSTGADSANASTSRLG